MILIDIFLNREQISNNSISNRDLTFFQIVSGSSVIDLRPETRHDKLVTTRAKVKARRKIQGKGRGNVHTLKCCLAKEKP